MGPRGLFLMWRNFPERLAWKMRRISLPNVLQWKIMMAGNHHFSSETSIASAWSRSCGFHISSPKKGMNPIHKKKVRTSFCWKKQSLLVVVGRSISMSKSQERSIQSFGPWQRSLLYCWRTGMSDDWHRLPPPATVIYPSYLVNLSRGLPKNFCQDCKSIRNFSGLFNANCNNNLQFRPNSPISFIIGIWKRDSDCIVIISRK